MPRENKGNTGFIPYADSPEGTAEDLEFRQRCRTLWLLQRGESVEGIAEELGVTLKQATDLADDLRPVATLQTYQPRNELREPIDRENYREPHAVARQINLREYLKSQMRARLRRRD